MYGSVYLIVNKVNGKSYVGLTKRDIAARWKSHVYAARYMKSYKQVLIKAIRKYGEEAFFVTSVFSALDRDSLKDAEKHIIKTLAPEYNMTNGGELTPGAVTEKTIAKRVAKLRGQKRTPEQKARMSESRKKWYMENPQAKARIANTVRQYFVDNPEARKTRNISGMHTAESQAKAAASRRKNYLGVV